MFEIMPQWDGVSEVTAPWRHVFVYGTLRRGEQRDINRLLPEPVWVSTGQVLGRLYDLGSYPGLLMGGDSAVVGEIYVIHALLERQLDEIEEVWPHNSGEYLRQHVPVRLTSGTGAETDAVMCLVYAVNPERLEGKTLIEYGDWVSYRRARMP